MPRKSEHRRHLSMMILNAVYALLEKARARSGRSATEEVEVAIARHCAYPEKLARPPLGEAPAVAPDRKPGSPPA